MARAWRSRTRSKWRSSDVATATRVAGRSFNGGLQGIAYSGAHHLIAIAPTSIAELRLEGTTLVGEASLDVEAFLTATADPMGRWVLLRGTSAWATQPPSWCSRPRSSRRRGPGFLGAAPSRRPSTRE